MRQTTGIRKSPGEKLVKDIKRAIGQSPGDHAVCWKLLKAKQALQDSQTSAEQIAFDHGYSSASAFSRAFRKSFGLNPRKVRSRKEADAGDD